jgi:hypothetical protein
MFILQLDRYAGLYGECICGVSNCNEWKAAEIHTRTNNGKLLQTGIMMLYINLQYFRYATYKDYACEFFLRVYFSFTPAFYHVRLIVSSFNLCINY